MPATLKKNYKIVGMDGHLQVDVLFDEDDGALKIIDSSTESVLFDEEGAKILRDLLNERYPVE